MKLAALGVVTAGIGVALTIPGLIGIGVFWVLIGLVARAYKNRLQPTPDPTGTAGSLAGAKSKPPVDARTFFQGTLLWLAIGVPSLAVGLFELGIDAEHADWRWLPIAVGAFALGIGVLGAVLYGAGSVALAASDAGGTADKPATIWIRKVTETGTFVNERPRLEFDLHVEPDAGTGIASYDVTKKATVPFTAIGSLRVGDGFRATVVGPDKPASMDIDWASPVPAATAGDAKAEPASASGSSDVTSRLDALDRLRRDAKITDEEYQTQRGRILDSL